MSMLEKNVHDAQFPTGPAANHLQSAAPFTGQPPTLGEIQCRADTIDLDYGGLYGNDLDDWLRAERELTEARRLRASAKDKNPR